MQPDPELQSLVEMARVGQRPGIEGLYRRFATPVFSFASAMLDNEELALKATERTFLQALRAREDIRDAAELDAWIHQVALAQCREVLPPSHPLPGDAVSAQERLNRLDPEARAEALLSGEIEAPRRSPPLSVWAVLDRTLTAQRHMRSPGAIPTPRPGPSIEMMFAMAIGGVVLLALLYLLVRRI